jgi:meso-butanediol dehydrogenase / (S,S)-butanediol dehydrogenase / diacetyl reductase
MTGGRKVLVTGGASGFGLAIAQAGMAQGWRVVIADIAKERLRRATDEAPELHGMQLDVTNPVHVRDVVQGAEAFLGGLDTVVVCAGIIHVKPLEEVTEHDWDATLDVNLKGAFFVVQSAAAALKRGGRGRVVLLSSMSGKYGRPHLHAYVASKFGLMGLAQSLAAELASSKVTVNCICPAISPMTGMGRMLAGAQGDDAPDDETLREISASFPVGRYVEEADVAAAALYLASDAGALITGSSIDLDGGRHCA